MVGLAEEPLVAVSQLMWTGEEKRKSQGNVKNDFSLVEITSLYSRHDSGA